MRSHTDTPSKRAQSQRGGGMCQQLEEKQGEGICVLWERDKEREGGRETKGGRETENKQ